MDESYAVFFLRRWTIQTTRRVSLIFSLVLLLAIGCNRSKYRQEADREAYTLIGEKMNRPEWVLPRVDIQVAPESRMFDPFDPDRPPMPPDDPVSHELMHCVDGKPNYPCWGQDGYTSDVQNPAWLESLPRDERGVLKLDLRQAMRLALLHSPNFQEELEELYLSALDVSAERFQFDTQFFGTTELFYRISGEDTGQTRSELSLDRSLNDEPNLLARKTFITGANLVVGLANTIMWNFHGADSTTTTSLLNMTFIQPLLRGAGRDRVLTRLTLAERNLLANVRQMERFRRGFYLETATGDGGTFGPRRLGGLFGGSGLQGFTGVGGGFGGVGGFFSGAGGARGASDALQVGGFLGLLQNQQNIRNQRSNIEGLRSNVIQFQQTLQENLKTIPEDPTEVVRNRLQIAQARQTLYNQEFALASAEAQYQAEVDNLKVDLGLPPQICVEISDPLLDRFNLLDTAIVPLQREVSSLSELVGAVNEAILASVEMIEHDGRQMPAIAWSDQLADRLLQLQGTLHQLRTVQNRLNNVNISRARADIDRLNEVLPERRATLTRLRQKYPIVLEEKHKMEIICQTRLPADIDPYILDVTRLDNLSSELEQEFERLRNQFASYEEPLSRLTSSIEQLLSGGQQLPADQLYRRLETQVIFALPALISQVTSDLLDLSLLQARARTDSVDAVPVDLGMDDAVCIASTNRRDWMNARATLVDTWRAIAFVANDLEGVLDIVVDGDIATVGDNPVDFRSSTGTLSVGVQFDAPFTRLLERNNYRQVLIDYQQARRNYYQFVDRVSQSIRNTIRTVALNELNFETRRVAVLSAIEQIVLNDEIQTLNEERGQAQGVTAARDIVQALSDLQDAQDAFMGVWLTYEVNRQFLDYNLGTMQLDEDGMWVDPGPIVGGEAPYICEEGCEQLMQSNVYAWYRESDANVQSQQTPAEPGDTELGIEANTPPVTLSGPIVLEAIEPPLPN